MGYNEWGIDSSLPSLRYLPCYGICKTGKMRSRAYWSSAIEDRPDSCLLFIEKDLGSRTEPLDDFPVMWDLCFAHGILGSLGGKHCESLQRDVWRGVVSPLKAMFLDIECRILQWFYEKRRWLVLVRWNFKLSFCAINVIKSIDKHSLRVVECEIYVYWIYTAVIYMKKRSRNI